MAISLSLAFGVPARALITHAAGGAARRDARQRGCTPSPRRRLELAARTVAGLLTNAAIVPPPPPRPASCPSTTSRPEPRTDCHPRPPAAPRLPEPGHEHAAHSWAASAPSPSPGLDRFVPGRRVNLQAVRRPLADRLAESPVASGEGTTPAVAPRPALTAPAPAIPERWPGLRLPRPTKRTRLPDQMHGRAAQPRPSCILSRPARVSPPDSLAHRSASAAHAGPLLTVHPLAPRGPPPRGARGVHLPSSRTR
jgi:hypothetical protein